MAATPEVSLREPAATPPVGHGVAAGRARWWAHYRPALTTREFLFAVATGLLTLVSWGLWLAGASPWLANTIGIAGALVGGAPIAWGAVAGLRSRQLNVDELVALAIVASLLVGEYWGAALVAFMMLFGKVLEDVTAARAEHAIEGLGRLVPALACVKRAPSADSRSPTTDGRSDRPPRVTPEAGGYPPEEARWVPVEQVQVGDIVVVRPGERMPVDGVVLGGQAAVEEAAITGEPLPVEKGAGDEVFAGTLATAGALEVRTMRTGEATALGRIAALVAEATAERAPIVRLADRWAKWFTPAVLVLAALVFVVQRELMPAVTVLVVACPCALVLATPTAVIAGIARGARRGILIKGGARLEAAGHIDAVCLDKTGTLTLGRPRVERVVVLSGATGHATGGTGMIGETELLAYAAAAERLSEHPLARAVVEAAQAYGAPVPVVDAREACFVAIAGKGVRAHVPGIGRPTLKDAGGTNVGPSFVECPGVAAGLPDKHDPRTSVEVLIGRPEWLLERGIVWPPEGQQALDDLAQAGQTPVVVAIDGRAAGVIGIADTPRPEAAAAIAALRAAGIRKVVLLTGDREAPALAIAAAVGIAPEHVHAELLPEEKVAWVRRLQAEGHRVAMVGDGVNDAPALAAADIAIAMGVVGTDVALAAADVALMTDDLHQAAAAIVLSRKTLGTIRQNLVFAAVWNVAAVAVAALGGFGPVAGALVHNVGSVGVVVNAARLVNARVE
ncbi:MAG: cation-translocating P-type ATPase [Chloroflexi bacterium]|nr:cation-translocating P-type ATPase [Chloroflexota bacterium]